MTLLLLSFIAGILTVLAPCILPLLPVIVGGTLSGQSSKRRAIIVTASLAFSIIAFTYFLKVSTLFIMVAPAFWQWLSGGIIVIFGLVTLFPALWEKLPFVGTLNRESNKVLGVGFQKKSVWGAVLVGASLGPVFSSCSPTYFLVLATVLPRSPLSGLVYLVAYALGLSIALLLIALVGQRIVDRLGWAADPNGLFKKGLGLVFVLVGIAVLSGYDKKLENKILDSNFNITRLEQKLLDNNLKE